MRTAAEEEALAAQVAAALECPCVADLRASSCGEAFTRAFTCYVRSSEPEKGTDCAALFLSLQACMVQNSSEFAAFGESIAAHEAVRDTRTSAQA